MPPLSPRFPRSCGVPETATAAPGGIGPSRPLRLRDAGHCVYPASIRGQACLAAGRGREAAAELQNVLDHRGVVLADPIGVLAHLQLGRVNAASGDKARAKSAYQNFLTLWKDADPDLPVFKRANAEYSKP